MGTTIDNSVNISNKVHSLEDNILKGECLECCISIALDEMDIPFADYSHVYNFNGSGGKFVPDYLTDNYLIESKNWDCTNYHINHVKAYNEIHKRRTNFLEYKPILIISNPKWIKREKAWLSSTGWTVYELGYFVTVDNMDRAIDDIIGFFKVLLGYVNTVCTNLNFLSKRIVSVCNLACVKACYPSCFNRFKDISIKIKAIGSRLYGRIRKYLSKRDSKNKVLQSNKSKLQIKLTIEDSSRYPEDGKYLLGYGCGKAYFKEKLLGWVIFVYEFIGSDKKWKLKKTNL